MKKVYVVLTGYVGDEKSFLESAYLNLSDANKRADDINIANRNNLMYAWVYAVELK